MLATVVLAASCSFADLSGLTDDGTPGGVPPEADADAGRVDAGDAPPETGCAPSIAVTSLRIPSQTDLSALGPVYWATVLLQPAAEKVDASSPFFGKTLINEDGGGYGNFHSEGKSINQRYGWTDAIPTDASPNGSGAATRTTYWGEISAGEGFRVSAAVGATPRVFIADVDALEGRFEVAFTDGSQVKTRPS